MSEHTVKRILPRAPSVVIDQVVPDPPPSESPAIPHTRVYTKTGSGQHLPGTLYVLCNEPAVSIAAYLQGQDVAADRADGVPFVPQFDVSAGAIVGTPRPVSVFLVTDHHIDGIPTSLRYRPDLSGVYTCRRERVAYYKNDENIVWVYARADVKKVMKSEDKILEVAKLLVRTKGFKEVLHALAIGLKKLIKALIAFI